MSSNEIVVYFQGLGRQPEVQQDLPNQWEESHNLEVIPRPFNWRDTDYKDGLQETGELIVQLAQSGKTIYLMGASGGGKPALSLSIRYSEHIQATAIINGKADPYAQDDDVDKNFKNLRISSDVLEEDFKSISPEVPKKILWMCSETDERIDSGDRTLETALEEAERHVMSVDGHAPGIEQAITEDSLVIINFFRRKSGILIPSE